MTDAKELDALVRHAKHIALVAAAAALRGENAKLNAVIEVFKTNDEQAIAADRAMTAAVAILPWKERAEKAEAALAEARRDVERGRYMISNCEWRRGSDDRGDYSEMVIRLPYDSDLSCKAMRDAAIDAAIAESKHD